MIVCWRMKVQSASSSGPGLCRIASGIGDLADVVQLGGAHHDVEVLGVEAQARAHRARELGHVVHVALQIGLAFAQDGEQDLARLARVDAAAVLERVHAVVGQPQRLGGVARVAGERDQAVGGVDREGLGGLGQRVQRRDHDRVAGAGVVVEQQAELVAAQAVGAPVAATAASRSAPEPRAAARRRRRGRRRRCTA